MKVMLMLVEPRGQRDTRSEDVGRALCAEMLEFGQGFAARGQWASESLRPNSHGVRIQRHGEQARLIDGPFTEPRGGTGNRSNLSRHALCYRRGARMRAVLPLIKPGELS